jgi:hypothetical protein
MYRPNDDEPRVGGGFAATFFLLVLVCVGAFGAVGRGAFKPVPPARLLVAPGKIEQVLGRLERMDISVSSIVTASNESAPMCNFEACERAFLSFRSSDCTFQPYDGPRRLCSIGNTPNAKP